FYAGLCILIEFNLLKKTKIDFLRDDYINFRMRAMLVSFLTHNCWQPWQAIAPYLAQLFLDYEPGIHYPQIQMQAGTVGTHIIRTYDVVKQSYQQDPMGTFIKQWVPELSELSLPYVHEPWKLSQLERKRLIPLYPEPVVDLRQSRKHAQDELWALKKSKEARQHSKRLLELLSNTKGS
ncbi:MAG: FAD-binding domain-containing protein, partial [Bacteroidia bacterium]|nr:FAD-binding domain-containing protein [Bacteroidia bacterium]